ncbi:pisatin demethylase [Stemphylium lycopersici]|uniref:Pisatin demethylase n=1 Tax=Stemphylium lycopersici TaxID=183478 RepID=A0A364NFA8_STELY|nr:pisatin demethylase [Stemphylium lycopersici]
MSRTNYIFAPHLTIPILLTVSFSIYCLAWIIYARYLHPLAKYPGPFVASITRFWYIVDVARGSSEKTQRHLHELYGRSHGKIVRIAPNEVVISDPEAIKAIYSAHSRFTKVTSDLTDFYLPFRATWARYPDAFTNLDERQHAERRRIVNPLYSMSNVVQLEENIDKCLHVLIERFSERAAKGNVVDISEWAQWYAFDVIGQLFFSCMFGFLESAYDFGGYIHALDLLIPFIAVSCVSPTYLRPLVLISGAMVPRVFKALKALKHIEKSSEACVTERHNLIINGKAEECEDMLQGFFNIMREKGQQKDFGMTEVKMEAYGAFIAGSDTTAAAITAILYHLMRTPSAYANLTAEIDEADQAGLLSASIQYHEAVGLPYLMACCKEAMRLFPSVGMTLPRQVPQGGCVIAGEWFPEGARVGVNAAIVQRDRGIFGEDADEFMPERWFHSDAAKMDRYMFQVRRLQQRQYYRRINAYRSLEEVQEHASGNMSSPTTSTSARDTNSSRITSSIRNHNMSSKLSLLDLPPETRIQIYNYLSPVHSYARDYSGLHLSCRKIRSEYTYEALKSIRHSYKRLETKLAGYDISIIGTPESIFRTSTLSVELPQSYLSNPFRTIPAALIPWRWLCCKTLVVNINADHPYVHARLPVMRSLLERFTETVMRRSPTTVHEYFRMRPEKQFAIKEIVVQWRDPRFHHLPPSHSISACNMRAFGT